MPVPSPKQKKPKPDNITAPTSNYLAGKGPCQFTDGTRQPRPRWCTDTVRWPPTLEPLPHPLEHHDRIKTRTLWSLPSRENWNAAERPSLRHLISEAVRDLADDPLPLAQPPSPPGSTDLQTTCTHQFASGCYFADLDVRKSRLADGGRGPGRAKASTAFETIKHTLTCLKHFV